VVSFPQVAPPKPYMLLNSPPLRASELAQIFVNCKFKIILLCHVSGVESPHLATRALDNRKS
jgi:hypothetical protein